MTNTDIIGDLVLFITTLEFLIATNMIPTKYNNDLRSKRQKKYWAKSQRCIKIREATLNKKKGEQREIIYHY